MSLVVRLAALAFSVVACSGPVTPSPASPSPTIAGLGTPSTTTQPTSSSEPSPTVIDTVPPETKGPPPLSLFESPAFPTVGNRRIPARYTCDGANVSPALHWDVELGDGSPITEYAIAVTDGDANGFVHWVVAGIPGTMKELSARAGDPNAGNGLSEGPNDFGKLGYGGPCPPPGRSHRYEFDLYAFPSTPSLPDHPTVADIRAASKSFGASLIGFSAFYGR